jgi:hypothetical protein
MIHNLSGPAREYRAQTEAIGREQERAFRPSRRTSLFNAEWLPGKEWVAASLATALRTSP